MSNICYGSFSTIMSKLFSFMGISSKKNVFVSRPVQLMPTILYNKLHWDRFEFSKIIFHGIINSDDYIKELIDSTKILGSQRKTANSSVKESSKRTHYLSLSWNLRQKVKKYMANWYYTDAWIEKDNFMHLIFDWIYQKHTWLLIFPSKNVLFK